MKDNIISEPKQKRSIEKKQKIIAAGLELFSKKGYHNTNTAEIAKVAGVSTGIVYRYFPDKKAILLEGLPSYISSLEEKLLSSKRERDFFQYSFSENLCFILDQLLEYHKTEQDMHEQIESLINSDSDVQQLFLQFEQHITTRLVDILHSYGIELDHPYERVHMVYNMIQDFCHETLYHKHEEIDTTFYKSLLIKQILLILQ